MNTLRATLVASALAGLTIPGIADDAKDHQAHHPAQAASSASAAPATPRKSAGRESMVQIDQRMTAMREAHEKMMNAKTLEERNALMAEHMKAMQDGMSMMGGMGGMSGNGKMSGMMDMPTDMPSRQRMMEKRMDMMESMMQMMMDRMPPQTTK